MFTNKKNVVILILACWGFLYVKKHTHPPSKMFKIFKKFGTTRVRVLTSPSMDHFKKPLLTIRLIKYTYAIIHRITFSYYFILFLFLNKQPLETIRLHTGKVRRPFPLTSSTGGQPQLNLKPLHIFLEKSQIWIPLLSNIRLRLK